MRKIVVFEIGKKRRKNSSWYVFCLQLRDLTQENLNRLVGIVTEDKYVEILTEYCAKGSLADVLENDSLKLDWPFRFSLISDIINVSLSISLLILLVYFCVFPVVATVLSAGHGSPT